MSRNPVPQWDPRSPPVLADQIAAYDAMRQRCPVAHSDYLHWSVFRHAQALDVLLDPDSFSSEVSTHVSVPNGMDPPLHTTYRRLIEPYFDAPALAAFEPVCRRIANDLVAAVPSGDIEWMDGFARECALQLLCAYMGWPATLHEPLRAWARKQQAATLAQDRAALADIAFEFDGFIGAQLDARRTPDAPDDVTTRLVRERMDGEPLSEAQIVSIARNWTVGELSTMAACFGIVARYLAAHPALQEDLRAHPLELPAAIDEILRIDPPLIANRRVARRQVELGGTPIEAGERVSVLWASANRDERVFGDPDEFRLDRDPSLNLLYGAGIHVCPGAPLARLQLRVVMEVLLAHSSLECVADEPPVRACYPTGGYSALPLRVERLTVAAGALA